MEINDEKSGVKFELPDKPSVLAVITYDSKLIELSSQPYVLRLWEGAKLVIKAWECEALPDLHADLAALDDARIAEVIEFTSARVWAWRAALDKVPKN